MLYQLRYSVSQNKTFTTTNISALLEALLVARSLKTKNLNSFYPQITCCSCSHKSFKYQPFTFLSVPLLSESYITFGKSHMIKLLAFHLFKHFF